MTLQPHQCHQELGQQQTSVELEERSLPFGEGGFGGDRWPEWKPKKETEREEEKDQS